MLRTNKFKLVFITIVLFGITACSSLYGTKTPEPAPAPVAKTKALSATALKSVSKRDVLFAQTALTQLGYELGTVDGLWGPRSAKAIKAFEKTAKIKSAGGKLSELNLYTLSKTTKVLRSALETKPAKKRKSKRGKDGIVSKLDKSTPLSVAPQLIILEKPYPMLAKANPYSEVTMTLQPGTGVYVIARQGEWFEIESLEPRERGFIKEIGRR